jgi:PAS domain S-box-containing protein
MKLKKPNKEEIKILVVDDETIVTLDIKNTLEKYGYKVVGIASSSQEAIKLVKSTKPDLILMDIMIKGSKDGIETAQEINTFADIPIIFLTAYSDDSTLERAKLVEPYGYLIKPFDNRELFTTIEMSLYKHSMEVRIKQSEENLAITLNSIGDAVISTDEKGMIVKMNPVAETLTGWKYDEAKGLPLEKIFYLVDATTRKPIPNPVSKVIESGNVIGLSNHTLLIAKDGTERNISDSAAPIKDSEENIRGVVLVFSDVTESYNSRRELKESEEKFRSLSQSANDAIITVDKNGTVIEWNSGAERIFGYLESEIKGANVSLIIPDEYLEHYKEAMNKVSKTSETHAIGKTIEMCGLTRNGEEFPLELSLAQWSMKGEKYYTSIIRDITERKKTESELKLSETKFNRAFHASPVAMSIQNEQDIFLEVNESFLELTGYSKEEIVGHPGAKLNLWADKEQRRIINEEFLKNGSVKNIEFKFHRKNGNIGYGILSAEVINIGTQKIALTAVLDITERKLTEAALKESEEKFRDLFNTMPNGYYRSTPNGYFVDANPAFINMLGYESLEELKSLYIPTDVFVESAEREEILASNPDFISIVETYRLKRKDGKVIWVEDNARYIKDANGNVKFNEGICKDITDRKNAEDALRESEQLFNTLAQVSPVGIFRTRPDGYTTYVNPKWVRLAGISAERAMGDGWLDALHPDDREKIKAGWQSTTKKHDVSVEEYRFLRPNGTIVWVMGQAIPEFDASNNIVGYVGTITDITERKQAEDALRESEERLRILAEKTGTIVYDRNLITRKIHREGAIEEVLGYSRDELNSFNNVQLNELIDEKEKTGYFQNIKNILEKPGSFSINYKLKHKNGTFIFIEDNGIVLTDDNGKLYRVLGSMKDITLKKRAEDELRKLSHAVEQSQVSIVITNREGIIEYVNPKFCEVTGYKYEEVIGQNPRILKSGDWQSDAYAGMWGDISSGRSWTGIFHNKKKNGELFWESAHISPIRDFNGEITNYIAVKEDITEKVKNEEQLTKYREHLEEMVEERTAQLNSQNNFLRSLIDTIPNPLFVKDSEGCYTDVNPAFEKFFGIKKDELIGRKTNAVFSGETQKIAAETDEQLKRERGFITYELLLDRYDGKKVPVIVYKSSFGISAKEPEGIMGMFIDISERKEMEEKTIEALNREKELNEMKTNFISMASHEFRTPLTTILASADLVEMYYKKWTEDKVINHIKKIQDSVSYMISLLDDVLTLSRADRGKIKFSPTMVNLKDICSQLMNEIQYQTLPGHNLIFDYKLDDEIFSLDNKLLTQILNNLLSNAVKFSPNGGRILLSVTKKQEKIQFIVEDEGLGIDPNDLKNIFEPFYRGKNVTEIHGSGLGLNIVKNAVELHGGEILIESEVNKGTKITFTIRAK